MRIYSESMLINAYVTKIRVHTYICIVYTCVCVCVCTLSRDLSILPSRVSRIKPKVQAALTLTAVRRT